MISMGNGSVTFSNGTNQLEGYMHLYHGTSLEIARIIRKEGFKVSQDGMLGKGVYLSKCENKAYEFAKKKIQPSVLVCNVKLGNVIQISSQNKNMIKTWNQQGYDTAWAPGGEGLCKREENCVYDPSRIEVVGLYWKESWDSQNINIEFIKGCVE